MKSTVSDDNTCSAPKTPKEVRCEDQEATLRSVYSDPRNLDTDDGKIL